MKQRNQLRRLIGFRFTRHPLVNLPEERLTAIEKQLDLRVRELLSLLRQKKQTLPARGKGKKNRSNVSDFHVTPGFYLFLIRPVRSLRLQQHPHGERRHG